MWSKIIAVMSVAILSVPVSQAAEPPRPAGSSSVTIRITVRVAPVAAEIRRCADRLSNDDAQFDLACARRFELREVSRSGDVGTVLLAAI